MKKIFLILFLCTVSLCGCMSYENYYALDDQYLERRQLETRFFETTNEEKILVACAQLVQDMEFTLDESETKLGLITGYKHREMGSAAGKVALILLAGQNAVYDTEQKIYVTIVTTRNPTRKGYNVRAEFARVIWNNRGQARIEKIQDEETYRGFFEKLSQSLFLTANDL